jgi:hypothetical protein
MSEKKSMKSKSKKVRDYSQYPFMNLSLVSMKGEMWMDMLEFDGCYSISNYGRIWAAPRPILLITGQLYFTRERIRKQNLTQYFNSYTKEFTDQLSIHLRYEGRDYSFKVNRLVYHYFVKPLDLTGTRMMVVHKDGDNCNNRSENLVLMNGMQLYSHNLEHKKVPRTGRIINKEKRVTWSDANSPRPIVQYTLEGRKLKEFASVADAAKANGLHRGTVRDVATRKAIQNYGFVFRFKDDPYKGEHAGFSVEKPVTQFTVEGKRVGVFASVKEASKQLGFDPSTIGRCALHKARIAHGFVWRYANDHYKGEFKGKIRNKSKPVVQYSLSGERVARFVSVNEAASKVDCSAATILACAHKRSKVAHGYVWRFENEAYKGEYRDYRKGKPVVQLSLNGRFLQIYPTIQAAAIATHLTSDNIQKNVNGHNRTAGGFVWKFASQENIKKLPAFRPTKYAATMPSSKPIVQYTIEGVKLREFKNVSEAARAVGIASSGVSVAIDKPRSAAGFVWRTKGNTYRGQMARQPHSNKAKTITQYDLSGRKLGVYTSTKEAERETGVHSTTISAAARGKLKSTGGFIWRYGNGLKRLDVEKHYASSKEHLKRISKAVAKYTIAGEFIKAYSSIAEAAREEAIAGSRISAVANGKSKSAGGNIWRLV